MKYLHLGRDITVPDDEIVGIFDMDNTTAGHVTRKFLSAKEKHGDVVDISGELPKAFVLCGKKIKACEEPVTSVYLSQLGVQTLLRRAESDAVIAE